jgi:hypothetical protein
MYVSNGVDAPEGIAVKEVVFGEGESMQEVSIIGFDLAKHVFQVHGAHADGSVAFRRKLPRSKLLSFFAARPPV